jgi:hypothetical protein
MMAKLEIFRWRSMMDQQMVGADESKADCWQQTLIPHIFP